MCPYLLVLAPRRREGFSGGLVFQGSGGQGRGGLEEEEEEVLLLLFRFY